MKKDTQNVLPAITAEEQAWYDKAVAEQNRQYLLGIIDAVVAVLILIAGIAILLIIRRKNRRIIVEVPEYTRDIPQGNSPGGIANLFYFYSGGVTKSVQGRVFSATMLNLARKRYVTFTGGNENYTVSLTGDTGRKQLLTASEQIFFDMIEKVAEYFDGSFTMKQFKKFANIDFNYIDRTIPHFLAEAKKNLPRAVTIKCSQRI